jgi:hypothetical protein
MFFTTAKARGGTSATGSNPKNRFNGWLFQRILGGIVSCCVRTLF